MRICNSKSYKLGAVLVASWEIIGRSYTSKVAWTIQPYKGDEISTVKHISIQMKWFEMESTKNTTQTKAI